MINDKITTLTQKQIIDYLMIGAYLAMSDDFAKFIVEQAQIRYYEDKFDTSFNNLKEVLFDILSLVNQQRKSNFDLKKAYFLSKFMDQIISIYGKNIKEQNFIKDIKLRDQFNYWYENYYTNLIS